MDRNKTIILLVGHGSRLPRSNDDFEHFAVTFRKSMPAADIRTCYVELVKPDVKTALGQAAGEAGGVIVLPLFLFAAGHVKNDLPLAVAAARRRFPDVTFKLARPLGVHPNMVRLTAKRLKETARDCVKPSGKTAVLMIGRGSSDPDANGDFCKVVRLLEETTSFQRAVYCFIALVKPNVKEALDRLARAKPEAILIQPYLLFPGRLVEQLKELIGCYAKTYPWITFKLSPTLGEDELLLNVLRQRMREAEGDRSPLPCDTCQYRVPLDGFEDKVGGLKALLWSARHSFTHNQAMPHEHSHAPLKKHVLICNNVDCVERGSVKLIEKLKRLIKAKGLKKQFRVTKTSCMGQCGEGPVVAIYPDGVWYRECGEEYAQALLEKHLLNDQLIPDIVDHIMQ